MGTKEAIIIGEQLVQCNYCFRSKNSGKFGNDETEFIFSVCNLIFNEVNLIFIFF